MKYKILCSDLDGTLLTTKNDVSDFTINEIQRIKNKLKIVLVSARMPKSMLYLQNRLGVESELIICYNGALILDGQKELLSITIPHELTKALFKITKTYKIKLGLYYKDDWFVSKDSERVQKEIHHTKAEPVFQETSQTLANWEKENTGAHKIMLMGTKTSTDAVFPLLVAELGDQLHFYRSNDTLIEVAPKKISKLSAISTLLKPNESLQDVIAFGDNYNDMEMLSKVGCGVAVANAREEVKVIANHVTLKNTENGVAHFIQQHLVI